MDRQKIIDEIKGLEKNKFSLGEVEAEIQKRNKSPYVMLEQRLFKIILRLQVLED